MLDKLQVSDFSPLLNEQFLVHYGTPEPLPITLIKVSELRKNPATGRIGFSLIFWGSGNGYLVQNTYEVEHPKLGKLGLLMVPLGPDGQGMCYEIIFN